MGACLCGCKTVEPTHPSQSEALITQQPRSYETCIAIRRLISVDELGRLASPVHGLTALRDSIQYPRVAYRAGVEGIVVAQFLVDTNGTARDFEIIHDTGAGFSAEVVEAVASTVFTPARRSGVPVNTNMEIAVDFFLRECSAQVNEGYRIGYGPGRTSN